MSDAPAIEVSGLVKHYGDVKAVDGLDLEVRPGRCLGLLGPNGAGKSTTVNTLVGLVTPDAGRVRILGQPLTREVLQRIGVQLQETKLFDKLSCHEILTLFASFYREARDPDEVLELVGLTEKRDARQGKLSGGQKQRLALGCALANKPELLFLDEQTTGLDPQARRRVWEIVETFKQDGGTVLLTTHYMEEAELLCDDVVIVDHGRCIASGSPRELIRSLDAETMIEVTLSDGTEMPEGLFESLPAVRSVVRAGAHTELHVSSAHLAVPALLDTLRERGAKLDDLHTRRATLEDVFVHHTGRSLRDV